MKNTSRILLRIIILLVFLSRGAAATNCSPRSNVPISSGTTLTILAGSGTSNTTIQGAISYWSNCPSYGSGFPKMVANSSAAGQVPVTVITKNSTGSSCGFVNLQPNQAGQIVSAKVTLYTSATTTVGTPHPCDPADTLAHELGHVLGMSNAPASCSGTIMATQQLTPTGQPKPRSVSTADCNAADMSWLTPSEPGFFGGGIGGCTCGPCYY